MVNVFLLITFCLHAFYVFCSFVLHARSNVALQYDLTLVASDSLNEVEIPCVIYVRDLNDLPPEFEQMQYVVNITEETVFVDAPLFQVPSFIELTLNFFYAEVLNLFGMLSFFCV